jgi:hypothetical protein
MSSNQTMHTWDAAKVLPNSSNGEVLAMRCLSPREAVDLFGKDGFSVNSEQDWYRIELLLEPKVASQQFRIGGRPTSDANRLVSFAETLNRWLPPNRHRLLWVEHWQDSFPSTCDLFMAARVGLGEARSMSEAPGHYFDSFPYDEQDQTKISPEHARQTGILVGLMSLMMIGGWDGWLVADGSADRIEFWEGNLFFHSSERSRLADAESLMDQFHCPRNLV